MLYADSLSTIPVDRTRFAGFGTIGDTYPCSVSEVAFIFEDKARFPKENTGES